MTHPLPSKVPILGVNVDRPSLPQLLDYLTGQINHHQKLFLTTPNPEIILKAHHNSEYKKILNSSDIAIPDGIGLLAAAKYLELAKGQRKPSAFQPFSLSALLNCLLVGLSILFNRKYLNVIPEQISGDLLFHELIKLAPQHHWKIFLLGGRPNSAKLATQKLLNFYKFPSTSINFHPGAQNIVHQTSHEAKEITQAINDSQPHLLFVAYGAPWQERWIHNNLPSLKINLAMGIGGTLDEFADLNPPTPLTFRNLGLRWLWRLITQPKRIKRIWNAVVIFPWEIYKHSTHT